MKVGTPFLNRKCPLHCHAVVMNGPSDLSNTVWVSVLTFKWVPFWTSEMYLRNLASLSARLIAPSTFTSLVRTGLGLRERVRLTRKAGGPTELRTSDTP